MANVKPVGISQRIVVAVFILSLCLGGFLRFFHLGRASMMMDFFFYDICQDSLSIKDVWHTWGRYAGDVGQMPFVPLFTKVVIKIFHLPPDQVEFIRMPSAIFGFLAIPFSFFAGRTLVNRFFGLIVMLLVSLSPMLIQMSRELYFYSPCICGTFLLLWALGETVDFKENCGNFREILVLTFFGQLLVLYSFPGAWPFAFLVMLAQFFLLFDKRNSDRWTLVKMIALYAVLGIPLLVIPWGIRALIHMSGETAAREYWLEVFALVRSTPWSQQMSSELLSYGWGQSMWRVILFWAAVLSACVALVRFRSNHKLVTCLAVAALYLVFGIICLKITIWSFSLRRLSPFIPCFLCFLALGVYGFCEFVSRRFSRITGILLTVAILCAAFMPLILPAWWSARLEGKPAPYKAVSAWLNRQFPEGNVVVTDRFFTAGNEFRVHASSTCRFLGLIPNQTPTEYIQNRFRVRTENFFENNPHAVYLEQGHLYSDPKVGAWRWPEKFFSRHQTFMDPWSLKLQKVGMNYRASYDQTPSAGKITLYYNLPGDVLKKEQDAGHTEVACFDKGWDIVQTRDFRVWRLMYNESEMVVWNLKELPQPVSLTFLAVAPGGAKQVVLNGEKKIFPGDRVIEWTSGPIQLVPGENRLTLSDPSRNSSVPLLVSSLKITPLQP